MKILKIFGVVVGIHLFALMLIFANPGCSSTSQPPPAPIDTVAKTEPAPAISVPTASTTVTVPIGESPIAAAPINFNPDAPASAAAPSGGIRFMPTRPNTAAASTLVAEPVADVTPATTYVVKSGDSLWSIASKNHLTVAELAAQNDLKTGVVLQPGHKLLIPGKKPATAAAATTGAPAAASAKPAAGTTATPKPALAEGVKHTVKAGESLSAIAKIYGVKLSDVAVANNITDPQKIRAGMILTIPGWQTPGAKAAKAATKSGAPASTGKPAAESPKPLFNAPGVSSEPDSPIKAAPPPAGSAPEVPVIKVEEAPAPKKP